MQRLRTFVSNHGGTVVLSATLMASLAFNVLYARGVLPRRSQPQLAGIKLNSQLPQLAGTRVDGSTVTIDFRSDRPSIVYVMSPNCGWCERNYANIVKLAQSTDKYRFIGLGINGTRDELQANLAQKPFPFDVVLVDQQKAGDQPILRATPTMVVVNDQGRIQQSWVGALFSTRLETASAFFRVSLPGLLPQSAVHETAR